MEVDALTAVSFIHSFECINLRVSKDNNIFTFISIQNCV